MRWFICLGLLACQQDPAATLEAFDDQMRSAAVETTDPVEPLKLPSFRIYSPYQLGDVAPEAMLDDLAATPIVFFGELHNTEPVQALEAWVLDGLLTRETFSLAMEHFDRDVQPVLDGYAAGKISLDELLAKIRPWNGFTRFWLPLVDRVKPASVTALNVPKSVLNGIYGQFPAWPLDAVQPSSFLPPLPLPAWNKRYATHFEASFDYDAHGQMLGLEYDDALRYFTELAHLRDATMAEPLVNEHTFVVAGEWHVQAGIAVPDRVALPHKIITTLPASEESSLVTQGRWVADYVLIYQ